MPTLEQIQQQMKVVNVIDTFGTKKEIKFLPQVLSENEEIKYMTSGFLDGNTWLITCTNKRVIFLDKGMLYGLKQKEIPLNKINSIAQQRGLFLGKLEIWDGASKIMIENISKNTLKPFIDAVNIAKENLHKEVHSTIIETKNEDIPEQIKKLSQLKEAGILTEQEFSNKKSELLARI